MDALTILTGCVSLSAGLVGMVCFVTGPERSAAGWFIVASAFAGLQHIAGGDTVRAAVDAALLVVFVCWWGKQGGGKGPRRRLRRAARTFRGVRRTAPAGGAA